MRLSPSNAPRRPGAGPSGARTSVGEGVQNLRDPEDPIRTSPPVRDRGAVAGCLLLAFLCLAVSLSAAPSGLELGEPELAVEHMYLRSALAAPHERAFLQVITDARLFRDETQDTSYVYDLLVRYDPGRYSDRHAGLYPLTFESQFILWGKRVSLLTRSTRWRSGRFFLHDVSTGRHAWIYAREARDLYPVTGTSLPPTAALGSPPTQIAWLKLLHAVEAPTDLRAMSRWLRLMREGSRAQVLAQARALADTAAASP